VALKDGTLLAVVADGMAAMPAVQSSRLVADAVWRR
jgi:hypothetical protein